MVGTGVQIAVSLAALGLVLGACAVGHRAPEGTSTGGVALERVRSLDLLGVDALVEEALRRDPLDSDALTAAAELAALREDPVRRIEMYRRLLAANDAPEVRRALLRALMEDRRFPDALELFDDGREALVGERAPAAGLDALRRVEVELLCNAGRWDEAWSRAAGRVGEADCPPDLLVAAGRARALAGDSAAELMVLERALKLCQHVDADEGTRSAIRARLFRNRIFAGDRQGASDLVQQLRRAEHRGLPEGFPVAEMGASLDWAARDAEFLLLDGWPRAYTRGRDRCLENATRLLLEERGVPIGAEVDEALQAMSEHLFDAMDVLRSSSVEPVVFRVERDVLRRLVRAGHLVLVTMTWVEPELSAGHAAVVVGFDDRLGVALVEDAGLLRSFGVVPYADLEGKPGIVLADGRAAELGELPGVESLKRCMAAAEHAASGRWEAALAAAEDAVRLDFDEALAHRLRASALSALGRPDEAFDALRCASDSPRADGLEHFALVRMAVEREDAQTLELALYRARMGAASERWLRGAELALESLRRFEPGSLERAAQRVLDLHELDANALYWRGYARLWAGRNEAAAEDLELCVGLVPSWNGWWYLGIARERCGDLEGALLAVEGFRDFQVDHGAGEGQLRETDERLADLRERWRAQPVGDG